MPTPREEIDKILVDTYEEWEEIASWEVAFTDDVQVPFSASVLGMTVEVSGFQISKSDILQCRAAHGGKQRWIAAEDLDDASLPEDMRHLMELYRIWQGGSC